MPGSGGCSWGGEEEIKQTRVSGALGPAHTAIHTTIRRLLMEFRPAKEPADNNMLKRLSFIPIHRYVLDKPKNFNSKDVHQKVPRNLIVPLVCLGKIHTV